MTERPAAARPHADPPDRPSARTPRPGPRPQAPHGQQEQHPAGNATPDIEEITRRWHKIQAEFVDAPQQAVRNADALVQDIMSHLVQRLATERSELESQWTRGDQVSTEDLRVVFQNYRSLFQRLLSVP